MSSNESFNSAFIKAQRSFKKPKQSGYNPHFKNSFSTIGDIKEATDDALWDNGLSIIQKTEIRVYEGIAKDVVVTTLAHTSGESIESVTEIKCNRQNDSQAYGSGISYARRYALLCILNLSMDGLEDDGNASSQPRHSGGQDFADMEITPSFVFDFGKFKGKTIKDIPPKDLVNYIVFMESKGDLSGKLLAIKKYIKANAK